MRTIISSTAAVIMLMLATLAGTPAGAQQAKVATMATTANVTARLIAGTTTVRPGQDFWVALHLKIRKGWHTYWRNPGDSGEATSLTWTLPAGYRAGAIQWLPPHRLPVGPLMNFGYEDTAIHLVRITVPADAKAGATILLRARANWLVCEQICIPESGDLSLPLIVDPSLDLPDARWAPVMKQALAARPHAAPWRAHFAIAGGQFALTIKAPALGAGTITKALFFPDQDGFITNAAPQRLVKGKTALVLQTRAAKTTKTAKTVAGLLVLTEKLASGKLVRHAFTLTARRAAMPPSVAPATHPAGRASGLGLLAALGLAFLGGLLLNLMPCVFPVLSLKVLSFAKAGADRALLRANGVAYTAGVLICFLIVGGVLAALRLSGELVGWGYQLQTPLVVLVLFYIMVLVGLNLAGLFDFSSRFAGIGQGAAARPGGRGAFFTGVLAVVVATPCTAPFMAPAIGYALAQPVPVTLAVMLALGLGMALPFLCLSLWPALVRRLPKPGPWMEHFRQFMAFPMFGMAIWLLWVLTLQAGDRGLVLATGGALLMAFGFWLWRAVAAGGAGRLLGRLLALLAFAGVVASIVLITTGRPGPSEATVGVTSAADRQAGWQVWSPARVAALRAEGRAIFVDFTAAWCITCLVNKRSSMTDPAVLAAVKAHNVALLRADWTRRDAVIAKALQEFGRSGVPLYLFYAPGAPGAPEILPQILTPALLIRHFRTAKKPG